MTYHDAFQRSHETRIYFGWTLPTWSTCGRRYSWIGTSVNREDGTRPLDAEWSSGRAS